MIVRTRDLKWSVALYRVSHSIEMKYFPNVFIAPTIESQNACELISFMRLLFCVVAETNVLDWYIKQLCKIQFD